MNTRLAAFFVAAFIVIPSSAGAESIGNKYQCNGTKIKTGGKIIAAKSAKASLKSVIASTKAQAKRAPAGPKRTRLNNKVTSLKGTLADVKSCAAGTYVPEAIRDMAGIYATGTWNNTTFSSTGGLSASLTLSGTMLSVSINIGGMMFGSLTPAPVEFQHNVGGVKLPYNFMATGTTIGDLDVTITQTGLEIEETLVPSVPSILRATLSATFANGGFTGTFASYLAGNTQLAQGTITLNE